MGYCLGKEVGIRFASLLSIPFMGYKLELKQFQMNVTFYFQFPLWDTLPSSMSLRVVDQFGFQFPLWDTKNQGQKMAGMVLRSLSIPFMGYTVYKGDLVKFQYVFFQFPLWDTYNSVWLVTPGIYCFQFPLWDTITEGQGYRVSVTNTFNSLYGIRYNRIQ